MIQVIFEVKVNFEENSTQNYLAFQPIYRDFEYIGNTDHISLLKSEVLFNESITPPTALLQR